MGWGSRQNKKEKESWAPAFISYCFLSVVAHKTSCLPVPQPHLPFHGSSLYLPKCQDKVNPYIDFHHSTEKIDYYGLQGCGCQSRPVQQFLLLARKHPLLLHQVIICGLQSLRGVFCRVLWWSMFLLTQQYSFHFFLGGKRGQTHLIFHFQETPLHILYP